jgi:hypothetical protein
LQEVFAARVGVRVAEQAVVQAHFGLHAVGHADPGDGGFGFDAVGTGRAALGAHGHKGLHFQNQGAEVSGLAVLRGQLCSG